MNEVTPHTHLIYGDLPQVAEAIDLGTCDIPGTRETFENAREWAQNDTNRAMFGKSIPPYRRALNAVQYYREQGFTDGEVYRAEIPKLGTLVFQRDEQDWGTDWAVLDKNGEVVAL